MRGGEGRGVGSERDERVLHGAEQHATSDYTGLIRIGIRGREP